MLRKYLMVFVLVALTAVPFGFAADDAKDEDQPRQGWGIFLTGLEGGLLAKRPQESQADHEFYFPKLDDSFGIGGLFYRDISDHLRFETRVAFLDSTVTDTEHGDVGTQVLYFDFSLMPKISLGSRIWMGIPMGLGWAVAREDGNYIDWIRFRTRGLGLTGGSGMLYFAGLHFNVPSGDRWEFFADIRARRFHRLVNVSERTLKSFELSIGFTKTF